MHNFPKLNFPSFDFDINTSAQNTHIFDIVRKQFVQLNPEEWVRQHIIHYLTNTLNYPLHYLQVEKSINYLNLIRRYDVLIYDKTLNPFLIVECKSYETKIDQKTFNQIAMYNSVLKAPYLLASNGLKNYCCKFNNDTNDYQFITSLPPYNA